MVFIPFSGVLLVCVIVRVSLSVVFGGGWVGGGGGEGSPLRNTCSLTAASTWSSCGSRTSGSVHLCVFLFLFSSRNITQDSTPAPPLFFVTGLRSSRLCS